MNILITGCGGFVGSYLAEVELKRGNTVVGVDIADTVKINHLLNNDNFTYCKHSVLEKPLMKSLIKKCDLLYHFAAIADPVIYCKNPMKVLEVDLEATQLMIKLAYKYEKKIVFSSTSEVFGKNPRVPWNEDSDRVLGSTRMNRWSYSTSKAIGEHYCRAYAMEGLKYTILRFFNFYGPRLDFIGTGRVMTCFLDSFFKGKDIEVVEPGDQTRCFTYIDDGIEGILKASEVDNDDFNLGSTHEISIFELAKLMKKVGNFKSDIVFIPAEKKYGEGYDDIPRRVPDCSKAERVLGWKPTISLEEGLEKTIKYYKGFYFGMEYK